MASTRALDLKLPAYQQQRQFCVFQLFKQRVQQAVICRKRFFGHAILHFSARPAPFRSNGCSTDRSGTSQPAPRCIRRLAVRVKYSWRNASYNARAFFLHRVLSRNPLPAGLFRLVCGRQIAFTRTRAAYTHQEAAVAYSTRSEISAVAKCSKIRVRPRPSISRSTGRVLFSPALFPLQQR